jgi:hypothetical protein
MDKLFKYNMKKIERIASISKLVIASLLVLSLLIIVLSISNLPIQIFGQNDTINNDNQVKHSIPHNAVGHESHQVVQFVEPKDNTIFDGSITFKSSIPVDIIVYNDTSIVADNTNNTNIKPWKIDEKTFIPTTITKNATSGTIDFRGSGITSHIPYNQTYDVTYTIKATPSSIK